MRPKIGTIVVGAEFKKYRLDEINGKHVIVHRVDAKTNKPVGRPITTTLRDFNWMAICTKMLGPTARGIADGKITKAQIRAMCRGGRGSCAA
jgi:hypothetical protein